MNRQSLRLTHKRLRHILFSAATALLPLLLSSCSANSTLPSKAVPADVQIGNITASPVLAHCRNLHDPDFVLFENGQLVWHDKTSLTGWFTAQLSPAATAAWLAKANSCALNRNYDVSGGMTSLPTEVIWVKDGTVGKRIQIHGGLPKNSLNFPRQSQPRITGRVPVLQPAANIYNDSASQVDASTPYNAKAMLAIPRNVLALHDAMDACNFKDGKPWLPAKIKILLQSNKLPTFLSGKTVREVPEGLPPEVLKTFYHYSELDTAKYRSQILQLLPVDDGTTNTLSLKGTQCWFSMQYEVPGSDLIERNR